MKLNVKFNYIYPTVRYLEDADTPCYYDMKDFCEWIIENKNKSKQKRPSLVVPLANEELADLEWKDCHYDESNKLYYFRLKKLRLKNIPAFTYANDDSTNINLKENQFLGEFNLIIFDPSTQRLVIQGNYFGLSIGQISTALTAMRIKRLETEGITYNSEDPGIVKFEVLIDPKEIKNVKDSDIYRSYELRVSDMPNLAVDEVNSKILHKAIDMVNDVKGLTVTVKVGLAREPKDRTLSPSEIKNLISDIQQLNKKDEASLGLSVQSRQTIEDPLEKINILLPKLTSTMSLQDTQRSTIGAEYIYNNFLEKNYLDDINHMRQTAQVVGIKS